MRMKNDHTTRTLSKGYLKVYWMQGEEKKAIKFQHTFLMKVEKKRESFLFFFFSI